MALGSVLPQLAAAATLPEPVLRLSPAIAAPATDFPAQERALLRVEYQAAQTQATEADIVGDILARVRRMDEMVNEIHGLVETWPQAGLPPAPSAAATPSPASATPQPTPTPQEEDGASSSGISLTMRALMASVIVFLFWLLGKRHLYIKSQRLKATAAAPDLAATPAPLPEGEVAIAEPATPAERPNETATKANQPPIAAKVAAQTLLLPMPPRPSEPAPPDTSAAPAPLAPLDFETIADFGQATLIGTPQPHAPAIESGADQSLELAEIMVSMGLAHGAAEALTERIRDNPKRALYHWLKLLDVYRRSEMKEDFEHAAQELRQCFNVQPEGWEAKGSGSISLEDYPHLAAKLQQLWPTPACANYLTGLLEDNRGGTRHGFPQSVAEEILLLEKMLNSEVAPAPA